MMPSRPLRRPLQQRRPPGPIGLCSRNRRRSSASSCAVAYRYSGSLAIALRMIVSRSRGIAGSIRRGGARLLEGDPAEHLLPVAAAERRPERQQLVERHAQRVDVGAVVHDAPPASACSGLM